MFSKTIQRLNLWLLLALLLPCLAAAALDASASEAQAAKVQAAAESLKPQVQGGDFKVAVPNETIFHLANGLKVYLIEDKRFPLVCTRLFVRTGSTHESPEQYGISHVLEHMVFKGTTTRPTGQIAKDVEKLGGYLNAYTSFDKTCYLTDMPAAEWKTGIDIVRDMAFNPLLDAGELEKEKPVIISELEGNEDKPEHRLFFEMQKAALAGTPYAHPIIGTKKTIRAVTPESLRAYIRRWYQPQNMMLLVAGDIKAADVAGYIEKSFGSLSNKDVLAEDKPVDLAAIEPAPRAQVVKGAWNKVYLQISFPVPGLRDNKSLYLDMLSSMLAGDATSLFERRYHLDKHLVDSISVGNSSFSRAGLLEVSVVMDAAKTEEVFTSLVKDLRDLSMASFTEDDLKRAKANALDGFDRVNETLNGLASWRSMVEFELGGRQAEANVRAFVEDIDLAGIGSAYAAYARPEACRVRVLAPKDAKLPDLGAILDKEWPMPAKKQAKAEQTKLDHEILTLDNGMRLVLQPDNATPYLAVTLMASGGNALIEPSEAGLPELTASLLGCGAGDMDRVAFEKKLSEKSLALGASSSRQAFVINGTGHTRYTSDLLNLLKVMYTSPRFEETELAKEVRDMNAARVLRNEDPLGRMVARLWPMLFGTHPYGLDKLGTEKILAGFNREKVASWWKKQQAMPWILSVSGSYDREAVIAFAKSFAKASQKAVSPAAPAWGSEKALTVHMPEKNKAHLMRIFRTVPAANEDVPALMMLDAVLSGQSGLLFSQMRDKDSLGYTVMSQNLFFPSTGLMLFYAGTEPGKLDAVKKGFSDIIKSVCDKPLGKDLLDAGYRTLEGNYIRSRQSLASRSSTAAKDLLLGLPYEHDRIQLDKARTLKPEDLQRVAKKYFRDAYEVVLVP